MIRISWVILLSVMGGCDFEISTGSDSSDSGDDSGVGGGDSGDSDADLGAWVDGKATYYGGNPNGNACYWPDVDALPTYGSFAVAAGYDNWENGLGCGDVYEVTCVGPWDPSNTGAGTCAALSEPVRVVVTDHCPECVNTHFDFTLDPFEALWDGDAGTLGVMAIQFRPVRGEFGTNIRFEIASGSSAYYLAITPIYANQRIASIEWQDAGGKGDSGSMQHTENNRWVAQGLPSSGAQLPISFTLTDIDGDIIEADNVMIDFTSQVDVGANF